MSYRGPHINLYRWEKFTSTKLSIQTEKINTIAFGVLAKELPFFANYAYIRNWNRSQWGEVQIRLHLLLTSATDCKEQTASRYSRFTPGEKLASTHQTRRFARMGPSERSKKKNLLLQTGVEPRYVCPGPSLVSIPPKRRRNAFMNENFFFTIRYENPEC